MTITAPYNNFKFSTKSSAAPNGAGSSWSIVGNTAEGGSTLFRIYNSPTGSMACFYGVGDATNLTNGAVAIQGGLSVTNTTYTGLINCGTGTFTNLLSTNSTIPQLTGVSAYFTAITGSSLAGTNIRADQLTGTSAYFTSITGTNMYPSSIYLGATTPLSYYEDRTNLSLTFTGPWSSNQTGNIHLVRCGNIVVLTLYNFSATSNTGTLNNVYSSTGLTSSYRPATTFLNSAIVINTNDTTGAISINTSGIITMYILAGNFSNSSNVGIETTTLSYTII